MIYQFAVLNLALEWKSSWMSIIIQYWAVRIKLPPKTLEVALAKIRHFFVFLS